MLTRSQELFINVARHIDILAGLSWCTHSESEASVGLKSVVRNAIPQPLRRRFKRMFYGRFKRTILWEYMPQGWQAQENDHDIKGWDVSTVLEAYKAGWPNFVAHLQGSGPLGFWYETRDRGSDDPIPHNIHMSYAYALAVASRTRAEISMLDWGGAIGQYYALSKQLYPDLQIDYHLKELPAMLSYAKTLHPQAHVYDDESCLDRKYDFVLVSGSFHYTQDWRALLQRLAAATGGYLYLTRLPVVQHVPSFVFVQRPYHAGYETEYLGWCLNRSDVLAAAGASGLTLVREFVMGENPEIELAPEQNQYRGFLFRGGATIRTDGARA